MYVVNLNMITIGYVDIIGWNGGERNGEKLVLHAL